jgi:hypothetical protein
MRTASFLAGLLAVGVIALTGLFVTVWVEAVRISNRDSEI